MSVCNRNIAKCSIVHSNGWLRVTPTVQDGVAEPGDGSGANVQDLSAEEREGGEGVRHT